jgi:hypothetical protein
MILWPGFSSRVLHQAWLILVTFSVPGPERQSTLFREIFLNVSLIRPGFKFQLQVVTSLRPTAAGLVPRHAPSLQAKKFWFSLEPEMDWIPVSAWWHQGSLPSSKEAKILSLHGIYVEMIHRIFDMDITTSVAVSRTVPLHRAAHSLCHMFLCPHTNGRQYACPRISATNGRLGVAATRQSRLRRSSVRISTGIPYILTEVFTVFLSCSWQIQGQYLDQATTDSFHTIPNSPSINHSTIRRYISYHCNRKWRPIELWYVEDSTLYRQSAHRWR